MDNTATPRSRYSKWILIVGTSVTFLLLAIGYFFKAFGSAKIVTASPQMVMTGIEFKPVSSHRVSGGAMVDVSNGTQMMQSYEFTFYPPAGSVMYLLNDLSRDYFFCWADDGSPGLYPMPYEEERNFIKYPQFRREQPIYLRDQLVYFPDRIQTITLHRYAGGSVTPAIMMN